MKNLTKTAIALALTVLSFNAMAYDEMDKTIGMRISSEHPQKVVIKNEYKDTLVQLNQKLDALKQAQNLTNFTTLANEAKTLALQAKTLAPTSFTNYYDAKDNYREWGNIYYQEYRLEKLAEKLDAASSQSDNQFPKAQQMVQNLHDLDI